MGLPEVQRFFAEKKLPNKIIIMEEDTATVATAAAALGREPGEIAKTLAFGLKDGRVAVVVAMGTARIDNRKFKECFGCKAAMLSYEDTLARTGHPVGGVCPFGLPAEVEICLDVSLKRYETVFPAAGTPHSAVPFTPAELEAATGGRWVDVCKED